LGFPVDDVPFQRLNNKYFYAALPALLVVLPYRQKQESKRDDDVNDNDTTGGKMNRFLRHDTNSL